MQPVGSLSADLRLHPASKRSPVPFGNNNMDVDMEGRAADLLDRLLDCGWVW